jgi:uncharacterized protein
VLQYAHRIIPLLKKLIAVNLPRHPLRLNVGFLLNAQIGYSRDIHFDFPQIKLDDDLELSQFSGFARVSRTPQGILVQCQFTGQYAAECVRCLDPILTPIKSDFSELFAFDHRSTTESNLILGDDSNIDLEPLAREYLLLEVPISPLCRPDCKGLCAVCGENLNVTTCEHAVQTRT